MTPGTIVRLADGREATVVYNSLSGYGVRFGRIALSADQIEAIYRGDGNTVQDGNQTGRDDIEPEALLRDPWPGAEMPCVGSNYQVVWKPEGNEVKQ